MSKEGVDLGGIYDSMVSSGDLSFMTEDVVGHFVQMSRSLCSKIILSFGGYLKEEDLVECVGLVMVKLVEKIRRKCERRGEFVSFFYWICYSVATRDLKKQNKKDVVFLDGCEAGFCEGTVEFSSFEKRTSSRFNLYKCLEYKKISLGNLLELFGE